MAAAPDAPVPESVNLAEAVALISEAADPASPEASQDERPGGGEPVGEEGPAARDGEAAAPEAAGEAAAQAGEPAADAAASDQAAPDFWDEDDKKAWVSVPAELRPMLRKYEQQRLDFVAEKTRQAVEE